MFKKLTQQIQYAAFALPLHIPYAIGTSGASSGAAGEENIDIAPGKGFESIGNFTVSGIISGLLTLVLSVVGIVFFFMLIMGGVRWIMSSGDEKAVASARAQITNALIGLAIVFAAYAITKLLGTFFGINFFDFTINPIDTTV